MKVRTPNNTNIQSYLKPNTVYEARTEGMPEGCFEYLNHLLLDEDGESSIGFASMKGCIHLNGQDWTILSPFYNREYLQDFVYKNKIKTTLVSKYLGYSKGWLSQTMNRTDRGDLTEDELQDILKMLHVDWSHTGYVYVKATSNHAAYKTRPCVYEHQKHKDILQRAFWNGEFVHG